MEIWKGVVGFEDSYKVSNFGRIKSLRRVVYRKGKGSATVKQKILKVTCNNLGYPCFFISVKPISKNVSVHREVAKAFIDNPNDKPQVNHINGIKNDNRVENLEWCTNSENQKHAFKIGLQKRIIGEKNNSSKLTKSQVKEIRLNKNNLLQRELGCIYGVGQDQINRIINNKSWTL